MDLVQTYTVIVAILIVAVLIAILYMAYSRVTQKKVTVVAKLAADGSGTVTFTALDKSKTSITVKLTVAANSGNLCPAAVNGSTSMLDTIQYVAATGAVTLNVKVKSTSYAIVLQKLAPTIIGKKTKFTRSSVTIAKGSLTLGNKSNSIQLNGV